jgi:hypothetical protein
VAADTAALVAVFDLAAALVAAHTVALAVAHTVAWVVADTAASVADTAEDTADSSHTPIAIDLSHDLVLALVVADGRRDQAASG